MSTIWKLGKTSFEEGYERYDYFIAIITGLKIYFTLFTIINKFIFTPISVISILYTKTNTFLEYDL